jgi:hypothetical protein
MGRPPIGKVAMTGAERMRLYRRKHGTAKPVTKPAAPDHTALVQELAQAKAELAAAKARITELSLKHAAPDRAAAGADAARWEAEIAAFRHAMGTCLPGGV